MLRMPRRFRSLLRELFRTRTTITLLDLPTELLLQIAGSLIPRELYRLLQTNHFLAGILTPALLQRAVTVRVGVQRCSVLQWAAKHNQLTLMTLLLERGVGVDMADFTGMTALLSAVLRGHDDAVELLLRNRANPNVESKLGLTPLLLASVTGNATVTKALVQNGAAVDSAPGGYGFQNAMHHAAALGHLTVVDALIESGCDKGARDLYGVGAVLCATFFGREKVVERLLGVGGFALNGVSADSERMRSYSMTATEFHMSLYERCLRIDRDYCRTCRPELYQRF